MEKPESKVILIHQNNFTFPVPDLFGKGDFVAVKGDKREYYQVAYYLAEQSVVDREFGAFLAIADNYPKYVLSMDKHDFSRDGIIHKNMITFLMEGRDERKAK